MRKKIFFCIKRNGSPFCLLACLAMLVVLTSRAVYAADPLDTARPEWFPKILSLQASFVDQYMPRFESPYAGANSLRSDQSFRRSITETYGIYSGSQILPSLQAYLDVEMARGHGLSQGLGLAGGTNGDVLRQGAGGVPQTPFIARLYLRYIYSLSDEAEKVETDIDQLPGMQPVSRVEVKAGRMAASDDFDVNRYANNTRIQFLDWGFINNTAWDFAANTRGYSNGILIAWVNPSWRLAFGSYQMPVKANDQILDKDLINARGDNLELTLKGGYGTVVRFLAYENHAKMGNFSEALAIAQSTKAAPNVSADEKRGRTKYGFGLNLEQPISDDGSTGAFLRLGWNDGKNEEFAFTQAERHVSAGIQISGAHWRRSEDRAGIGYLAQGLGGPHRGYLAAGGTDFFLGDGKLNYGLEKILESYYRVQVGRYLQVSPDFMYIENPGYNRDRGPVLVYSLRLRLSV